MTEQQKPNRQPTKVDVPPTKTLTPWKVFCATMAGGVAIGYTLCRLFGSDPEGGSDV